MKTLEKMQTHCRVSNALIVQSVIVLVAMFVLD